MVGFDDLEDPVTKIIHENNSLVGRMADKVGELQKEIIEHRKFVEESMGKRDSVF